MRQFFFAVLFLLVYINVSHSQDDVLKKKAPHKDDETSLIRIKAKPETAVGKSVIICGLVEISDYYNYSYRRSEDIYYSLKFYEVGETIGDYEGQNPVRLYFSKSIGSDALEIITKAYEQKKGTVTGKLLRAKITLVPERFNSDKQWDMFEVLDVQFFDMASEKWLPWMVATAQEVELKQKTAMAEEERAKRVAKQEEEQAKRIVKQKAAADKIGAQPPKTNEEIASSKLKMAKTVLEKNKEAGRKRLQEIVDEYPGTLSAEKATTLLKIK
jgi:hypothetical protein